MKSTVKQECNDLQVLFFFQKFIIIIIIFFQITVFLLRMVLA